MPDSLSQYSPRQQARYRAMSVAFALLTLSIGSAVLLGWVLDVEFLKHIHPSLVSMKANTAICLILISSSLILLLDPLASSSKRWVAHICAALVGLVGLLTLSEHIFGWNLGIDQLLFRESPEEAGLSFPGRMGVAASLDFFFLGLALLFLDARATRRFRLSNISVLAVVAVTVLIFLYYF